MGSQSPCAPALEARHVVTNSNHSALLTPAEAASKLRLHPETIRRWCRSGLLNARRTLGGGEWRIDSEDVDNFIPPRSKKR